MGLERVDPDSLSVETVRSLGLDPEAVELGSSEGLAASLRRAASFLCPATPRRLIEGVAEALSGLPKLPEDETRPRLETLVELLVSHGDLLELPMDDTGGARRHLFLGPPAYVRRESGCLLLGVRPEGAPIVGDELSERVEHHGHVRRIRSEGSTALDELLSADGLSELRPEHWLQAPRKASAQELLDRYAGRLTAADVTGEIEGLRIIDPGSDVAFYRGRWRTLKSSDAGRVVARRPQAFGADLWCFAEVVEGAVTRLVDLPIDPPLARGPDEAWRLQAALDSLSGRPQRLRVRRPPDRGPALLDLFSPLPSWSQRRLDVVATPAAHSRGALFSYALPQDDVDEEVQFLRSMMWLDVDEAIEGTTLDR